MNERKIAEAAQRFLELLETGAPGISDAKRELNALIGFALAPAPSRRLLSDLAGTMGDDPELDEALRDQRRCQHRIVTTSAGPFCELCGAEL